MSLESYLNYKFSARKEGKDFNFYMNLQKNGFDESINKEKIETILKNIRDHKAFIIENFFPSYSIAESYVITNYNTFIFLNLPFCLHLPTGLDLELPHPKFGVVKISLEKIWTENAEGSDTIDIVAEECDTYYQNSAFKPAKLPQDPKLGWQMKLIGKNVEKEKDNMGYFRYTKIVIAMNTSFTKEDFSNDTQAILVETRKGTLEIINRLIEVYRFVTREEYIEKLGKVEITDIQFLEPNICFMPSYGINNGIGDAKMCHSLKKIVEIEDALKNDITVPLYETLILNAESVFNKRQFKFAIVESFQAFEIFLENFLLEKFSQSGLNEKEAYQKITERQNWMTTERLKKVLYDAIGHRLTDNSQLWQKWYDNYDLIRNEVIHHNKEVAEEKAREVLDTNLEVIEWIKQLQPLPPQPTDILTLVQTIDDITINVTDIVENIYFYKELAKIIENNSAINVPNHFYDFIKLNFLSHSVVSIWRQIDKNGNSLSLINLLNEILKHPETITKEWFVSHYTKNKEGLIEELEKSRGQGEFEQEFGLLEYIDPQIIRSDIDLLLKNTEEIKKFRNKRIAHWDKDKNLVFDIDLKAIETIVNTIEQIVIKYNMLLRQAGYSDNTLLPVFQYDWKKIFKVAWI